MVSDMNSLDGNEVICCCRLTEAFMFTKHPLYANTVSSIRGIITQNKGEL